MTLGLTGTDSRRRGAMGAAMQWAAVAAMLAATGCCSFERDWRASQNVCYPGDPLAGAWEGTWENHCNGHRGKLRAIIEPCGPNLYRARYHATFCKFLPYGHETTHTATIACGAAYFAGKEDLGRCAGGVHHYWGLANGSMYEAGYRTDDEEGVLRMQRVGQCCGGSVDAGETAAPALTPVPSPLETGENQVVPPAPKLPSTADVPNPPN